VTWESGAFAVASLVFVGVLTSTYPARRADGMTTMEQSLAELVKAGRVTRETAYAHGYRTDDLQRYTRDGFPSTKPEMTARLDGIITELESTEISFTGWATPGENPASATLDVARTVCRRAERRVCALHSAGELQNEEVIIYLNRLSDLLWLLARSAESRP
jgi:hypothetical protein